MELADGEKQKSIERPVINSFTVIKTPESLKGVRLLMSCDIFSRLGVPKTVLSHCSLPAQPTFLHSAEEAFAAGLGKRKKKMKGEGEERGRWDAFIANRRVERGGNNEISGLCEK